MMNIFDISNVQFTLETYLGCQIAFFLFLGIFWKKYVVYFDETSKNSFLLFVVVVLFSVYGFENGDFYGYQRYLNNKTEMDAMEPIYTSIAELVSYNYFLFRLIVWGGATCLIYKASENFCLKGDKTLFCMFVMFISTFGYARASLAMSIYFLGVSYLCNNTPCKAFVLVKGITLVILSYFFHHSMLVCILLTPILYVRLNKKRIILVLVLVLLSGRMLNSLFISAFGGGVFDNAELNAKLSSYEGIENGVASTFEWIRRVWEYSIFFIPIALFVKSAYTSKVEVNVPEPIKRLFAITFAVIVFAISTLVGDAGSFVFFYRYLYVSIIPISLVLCCLRCKKIVKPTFFRNFVVFCLLYRMFSMTKLIMGGNMF